MATEFLMPKLGLTMEEGTITEWFADDGASITAGAPLLRIETDKTETDVEAAATGRLHRVGQVGETFACGERIGWFLDEGEDAPASSAPAAVAPAAAVAAPPPPNAAPAATVAAVAHTGRVVASPLTKRLAGERNIDLRTVRGTGPGGRIVAADLDDLPAAGAPALPAPPASAQPVSAAATGTGPSTPATAAARSLADLLGVDLAQVPIDPIEQRVTKDAVALHVRTLIAAGAAPSSAPAPAPALLPALQEPTAHHPSQRDPGHDRQADARIAAPDGPAHALHGRRPRRGRRGPRTPQGVGSSAELHRLHHRGGGEGARAASARQLPDHRRRRGAAADRSRRHGRRPRRGPDRAGDPRHRLARPHLAVGRVVTTCRGRTVRVARTPRPRGRYVLGEHARHVRRRRIHTSDQSPEHGDPRRRTPAATTSPSARRARSRSTSG